MFGSLQPAAAQGERPVMRQRGKTGQGHRGIADGSIRLVYASLPGTPG
ncbi:MAG: hypothetical protein GYA23_04075 [Methanomicrobiales archaeon]|nr:hypothetical protein [Methanomicrobiales archaeon]